jgi:hypothetical protein
MQLRIMCNSVSGHQGKHEMVLITDPLTYDTGQGLLSFLVLARLTKIRVTNILYGSQPFIRTNSPENLA